jgi:flagellar biosynthetic protein FlhB
MPEDDQNKTEEPTPKRLQEAQAMGNFAKAPDLQTVAILAGALWAISTLGNGIAARVASIAVDIFGHLSRTEIRPEAMDPWGTEALKTIFGLSIPLAGVCTVAAILVGGVQTKFVLSPKVLELNPDKIDPVQGFQRIFSMQGLVKVATDAFRLLAVAWVIRGALQSVLKDPIFFTPAPVERVGGFIVDSGIILLWRCILALGIIGALNYTYQVYRVRMSLMMTKQEVRDEAKQSEGDPKIKSALRAMARRILQRQMLKSVETADVLVTNPVHFAVALRYDRRSESAPIVVAKGEQAFARRLKSIAAEKGVPVVENPPVARILYKFGRVGKPIPVNLYRTVAEILAFVYRTHKDYFRDLQRRRTES